MNEWMNECNATVFEFVLNSDRTCMTLSSCGWRTWSTVLDSMVLDSMVLDSMVLDSIFLDSMVLDSMVLDSIFLHSMVLHSMVLDSIFLDSVVFEWRLQPRARVTSWLHWPVGNNPPSVCMYVFVHDSMYVDLYVYVFNMFKNCIFIIMSYLL